MDYAKLTVSLTAFFILAVVAAPAASADGSGSVHLTAVILEPRQEIGLEISMAASDCGQMRPGNTSDLQYLSVTNIGSRAVYVTVTADCGAEPLFISDPLVDSATQGHNQITLAADESECAPLALPDHASRGVVVWAEAHSA